MSKRKTYSSTHVRSAYWLGKNKAWAEAEKFFASLLPGWKVSKTPRFVKKGKIF